MEREQSGREAFVAWVLEELQKRGWSQSELARRAFVTRSGINKLLSGERNPGPVLCVAIAKAFKLPAEEVCRRAGVIPRPRSHSENLEDEEELLYHFRKMTPEAKQYLLMTARAYDLEDE